jgi:hypothetical protein
MGNYVIALTNPIPMPSITHLKICSVKIEVPRPEFGAEGYADIWIARCYKDGDLYIESPTMKGINIILRGEEFEALTSLATTNKSLFVDFMETIEQFLIDRDYFTGNVVTE